MLYVCTVGVDKYRVNTNYEAVKEGELSLKVGDIVTVLEQTSGDAEDDIFWKVCCREAVGLFPANHMELIPINEGNLSEDELEDAIKKSKLTIVWEDLSKSHDDFILGCLNLTGTW